MVDSAPAKKRCFRPALCPVIELILLPPSADAESVLSITLMPSAYTAIVRGNGDTTGVALVEVYNLQ
ncbi:MAG: hypothetical protein ABI674_10325 [Spartobacteria bacterium]